MYPAACPRCPITPPSLAIKSIWTRETWCWERTPASSPDTPTSAWRRYPGWPPPLAERPFLHTSTAPPSLFWGCLACGCRSWDSRWRKYPANARRSSASARTWPGFGSSPTLTPTTWIRSGRRSTPWSCRSGRGAWGGSGPHRAAGRHFPSMWCWIRCMIMSRATAFLPPSGTMRSA